MNIVQSNQDRPCPWHVGFRCGIHRGLHHHGNECHDEKQCDGCQDSDTVALSTQKVVVTLVIHAALTTQLQQQITQLTLCVSSQQTLQAIKRSSDASRYALGHFYDPSSFIAGQLVFQHHYYYWSLTSWFLKALNTPHRLDNLSERKFLRGRWKRGSGKRGTK